MATLKVGSTGDAVKKLQEQLNTAIGAGLKVDGIFGAKTEAAVKQFQKSKGLKVDGIVGENTQTELAKPISSKKVLTPEEQAKAEELKTEIAQAEQQVAALQEEKIKKEKEEKEKLKKLEEEAKTKEAEARKRKDEEAKQLEKTKEADKAKKLEEETKAKQEALSVEQQQKLDTSLKIIDDAIARGDITADIGQLWKTVVQSYPEGVEVKPDEILNTFKKIEAETIDPYFANLTKMARQDVESALGVLKTSRAQELEAEQMQTQEAIRAKQAELEARGLTFGGEAVRQLGAQSALPTAETAGIEGVVPHTRRLLASSSALRAQETYRQLAQQTEQILGSQYALGLGIPEYQVIGGIKGTLEEQKEQEKAARLQQLISQGLLTEQSLLNL